MVGAAITATAPIAAAAAMHENPRMVCLAFMTAFSILAVYRMPLTPIHPLKARAFHGGGWPDEVGMALIDAVFSIRAKYRAVTPGRGVYGRARAFHAAHSEARDDLRALVDVGDQRIREFMGDSETRGRLKPTCVVEAAQELLALTPPVITAVDARAAGQEVLMRAYSSVPDLGRVTAEYFTMLLGFPGVKPDTMVVRFVNAALAADGLPAVNKSLARELVIAAHADDPRGATLTQFEHAIWRTKGALPDTTTTHV